MGANYSDAGSSDADTYHVTVAAFPHVEEMETGSGPDEHELALLVVDEDYEEDSNPIEMVMPRSSKREWVTSGLRTYEEWKKLTAPRYWDWDLEDGEEVAFGEPVEGKRASKVKSPSYDEMDELRKEWQPRIKAAETEEEERRLFREMWEEAQTMELDGHDSDVVHIQKIPDAD